MTAAEKLALIGSGLFFLGGLLTGIWKYLATSRSRRHEAPRYVSVAHQAALMYSFAALLLFQFLEFSPYSETVNILATAFPLAFFVLAILTYVVHGATRDTDNAFREPYRLGRFLIAPQLFHLFVWLLIISEVGGFLVLFLGFLRARVLP